MDRLRAVLYSIRHAGPSNDLMDGQGDVKSVKKRGRWRADESVRRYEKGALLGKEMLELLPDIRARGVRAAAAIEEVLNGTLR